MRTIEQIRWEIFEIKNKIKSKLDQWYSLSYLAEHIWLKKQTMFWIYKKEVKNVTDKQFLANLEKISLFFKNN